MGLYSHPVHHPCIVSSLRIAALRADTCSETEATVLCFCSVAESSGPEDLQQSGHDHAGSRSPAHVLCRGSNQVLPWWNLGNHYRPYCQSWGRYVLPKSCYFFFFWTSENKRWAFFPCHFPAYPRSIGWSWWTGRTWWRASSLCLTCCRPWS